MKTMFALLLFATTAHAQTFMCGVSACSQTQIYEVNPTGIENLVVRGQLYDVTFFATTENSPFAFSKLAATGAQPSTVVDAANAINAFYGTQNVGYVAQGGTFVVGVQPTTTTFYGGALPDGWNLITASPFYGYTPPNVLFAAQTGDSHIGFVSLNQENIEANPCSYVTCTTWTSVGAPELGGGWAAALTLLAGTLAVGVSRGRR